MKVKLRHEDEAKSVDFIDWDPKDIDRIEEWFRYNGGVYVADEGTYNVIGTQIVLDHRNNEAYFEVILMGDPE